MKLTEYVNQGLHELFVSAAEMAANAEGLTDDEIAFVPFAMSQAEEHMRSRLEHVNSQKDYAEEEMGRLKHELEKAQEELERVEAELAAVVAERDIARREWEQARNWARAFKKAAKLLFKICARIEGKNIFRARMAQYSSLRRIIRTYKESE